MRRKDLCTCRDWCVRLAMRTANICISAQSLSSGVQGTEGTQQLPQPMAPFDKPFHIILNLSVGGSSFAGFPPPGPYEQEFTVKWVSVSELRPA